MNNTKPVTAFDFARALTIELSLICKYVDYINWGTQNKLAFSRAQLKHKKLILHLDYALQFYVITRLVDICSDRNERNKQFRFSDWIFCLRNSVSLSKDKKHLLEETSTMLSKLTDSVSFKIMEEIRDRRFAHHEVKQLTNKQKSQVVEFIWEVEKIQNTLAHLSNADDCCVQWFATHAKDPTVFTEAENEIAMLMAALDGFEPW